MKKIVCWVFGHHWWHYVQFLKQDRWDLVDSGNEPEAVCGRCGTERYKSSSPLLGKPKPPNIYENTMVARYRRP